MARKREVAFRADGTPHDPAMFRRLSAGDHFDPCVTLARHEFCCARDGEVPAMHGRPFDEPLFSAARNLPVHGIDNKPSAPGPKGAVFGHCVFENACCAEKQEGQPAEAGSVAELQKELKRVKDDQKFLQEELEELRKPALNEFGISTEFNFGEKVYQCLIPEPGVGYRNTPAFGDKNVDGTGPQAPQVVIVDCICQGPRALFVRDSRNGLWLPLTSPGGAKVCFKLVGNLKDVDLTQYQVSGGKVKTKKAQGAWFGAKQG
eukprot:TRINITY_DN33582_c0_g1_i1.p1 TRINITY_DN33582_c0_g1~~TRINITY_DN33582_c0_g1_i1.p1  ORF type:complete len:261 (+),score=53.02 TRINITY_DN33582_c0_g1_i1:319-1101(+)